MAISYFKILSQYSNHFVCRYRSTATAAAIEVSMSVIVSLQGIKSVCLVEVAINFDMRIHFVIISSFMFNYFNFPLKINSFG